MELSPDTVKSIINEGHSLGYRSLHLTGGEPLLWDELLNTIDYSLNLGYESIFINSNGTLLSEDICKKLSFFGSKVSFSVSLQGPEEFHDSIRGKGSWKKAVRGIDNALVFNIPLNIFTSVGKSLLPILPVFADNVFNRFPDIKYLTLIQLIRVADDSLDLSEEVLDPDDFINMVRSAALLNVYGHRVNILENPLARAAAIKMGMPWLPMVPPLHRSGRLVVMADGSITLSHSNRESLGMYTPGILEKTISSGEYEKASGPDTSTCPDCLYYKLCIDNRMIRPSEWYRDMNSEEKYCRRVLDSIGYRELSEED